MKITLCGSIAFIDEMVACKSALERHEHEVKMPPTETVNETGKTIHIKDYYQQRKATATTEGWLWDRKREAMHNHFDKVAWADAILVLNYPKHGIEGYIGPNTLMEMGLAFHLRKPIYLLYNIPKMDYTEEIIGIRPTVINNNLDLIQ
jgi:nucleoside 2-deoxyribosyltransferase